MKKLSIKVLIRKVMWLLIAIVVVVSTFGGINFALDFVEMKFAVAQLNDGDVGYLLFHGLTRLKTFVSIIGSIVVVAIIALDINYFYQTIKKEGETK